MNEKSSVTLTNKEELKITGVNKINSLDSKHFNLDTSLGNLKVSGLNLEMNQLDSVNKIILIKGDIESISYKNESKNKDNMIKKLFK
jgi:sporulation protein YabP